MAKFCPNCGAQAVWLNEKPEILKEDKNMISKDTNYTYKYEYLAILIKIMKKNLLQVVKRKKDYLLGLLF